MKYSEQNRSSLFREPVNNFKSIDRKLSSKEIKHKTPYFKDESILYHETYNLPVKKDTSVSFQKYVGSTSNISSIANLT